MKVFFRYDDYSSLTSPGVDTGLIDIFRRNNATCTFAVVPAMTSIYPAVQGEGEDVPLSSEKAAALRAGVESGAIDVALHGWNHLANEHTRYPHPSEFKGLGTEAQLVILRRGREFLKQMIGVEPVVFVPPWNSYDRNTLLALDSLGFLGISANRYSPLLHASTRLRFAPMTIELGKLRQAVETARRDGAEDSVIGVMLHPYDFHESGDSCSCISLADFEKALVWLLAQDDVRVVSISALLQTSPDMNLRRLKANHPSIFENVYPAFASRLYSDPLYYSTAQGRLRKLKRDGQFLLVMFALLACGAVTGLLARWVLADAPSFVVQAMLAVVIAAIAALAGRVLIARAIYVRAASLLTVLFGVLLGLAL